jgi:hypothetical protein
MNRPDRSPSFLLLLNTNPENLITRLKYWPVHWNRTSRRTYYVNPHLYPSLSSVFNRRREGMIGVSRSLSYSFASACDLVSVNVCVRSYVVSSNDSLSCSVMTELIRVCGVSLPLEQWASSCFTGKPQGAQPCVRGLSSSQRLVAHSYSCLQIATLNWELRLLPDRVFSPSLLLPRLTFNPNQVFSYDSFWP